MSENHLENIGINIREIQRTKKDIERFNDSIDNLITNSHAQIQSYVAEMGQISQDEADRLLTTLLEIMLDAETKTATHAVMAIKSRVNSVLDGIQYDRAHKDE